MCTWVILKSGVYVPLRYRTLAVSLICVCRLCLDCKPLLQLMLFSHPKRSLQSIWSTCPHATFLATLASSSHSIPRYHDLLFQPTLSQLLAWGVIQELSTAGHSVRSHMVRMIFLALGHIWSQKTSILAWGLMFSGLLPTDPPLSFSTGLGNEEELIQKTVTHY